MKFRIQKFRNEIQNLKKVQKEELSSSKPKILFVMGVIDFIHKQKKSVKHFVHINRQGIEFQNHIRNLKSIQNEARILDFFTIYIGF